MQINQANEPVVNGRALLRSLFSSFVIWAVVVAGATFSGYPGVVCITPLAWIMAIPLGWNYIARSGGRPGRRPLLGAGLAGAILGVLYGALFIGVVMVVMPVQPTEMQNMIGISAGILVGGALIGAALSAGFAKMALGQARRR